MHNARLRPNEGRAQTGSLLCRPYLGPFSVSPRWWSEIHWSECCCGYSDVYWGSYKDLCFLRLLVVPITFGILQAAHLCVVCLLLGPPTFAMADNSTTPLRPPPYCAQYRECLFYWGYLEYLPNIPANAVFIAIFATGLIAQGFLGLRHRTWSFSMAMLTGIILEMLGYGARIGLHYNVSIDTWFIMYLCCLTIAPALFSAAIYLSLSRVLTICGENLSFLKGRTITVSFISCDFVSLALQAVGGAIASTAVSSETRQIGVNIMIAGLSSQVAATTAFSMVCLHIIWNIRKHPERVNREFEEFRRGKGFRAFILGM